LRGTKANQDRVVVLTPDATPRTLTGLRRHLRELGADAQPYRRLFVSNRGLRLDYDTLRYHWAQASAAVGLVGPEGGLRFTLHQLRHTRATELLASGIPESLVQRALGHRDPRSTQRYAQLDDEELRRALSRRMR
ncbi:MAG: tyrosine-type recombinase/integrase, partial [Oscillochloridaceae bacterium umkhey_bin13]